MDLSSHRDNFLSIFHRICHWLNLPSVYGASFALHSTKCLGFELEDFSINCQPPKNTLEKPRETHGQSVETGLFVIRAFWSLVSVTVEKFWLEALGTCRRAVSHASLSSLLAGDGRHESVWIRCNIDGGITRARTRSRYEQRPVFWLVCVISALVFL